ncbi:MAG TPA: GAF domain-containing protein [Ktedonobacteraceae bacterium]|jgi:hypothetical protein|nr:GAF domain-containing protein [Ktedonobacteraceae bacterium]
MEKGHEPSTWQEFLGQLIENAQERERIAEAAHVRTITLQRWASGSSRPRDENMRTLLKALPFETQAAFAQMVSVDFPGLLQEHALLDQAQPEIPADFYARVLSALALTPAPMCRQTIQDLIFRQILEQFDSDRLGMSVSLVCCVLPRHDGKVRSLREVGGMGTPPWKPDLAQKTMFLGAESLVGHVISTARPDFINSKHETTFLPANWTSFEQSVAAFPLCRMANVAGGLLVSSTQEHFFTPTRVSLLERYAHLTSLIFEPVEFYRLEDIDLRIMPSEEKQAPYFRDFNQRVSQKFAEAVAAHRQITLQEARQLVWQDIEVELLQVFLRSKPSE